MSAAIPADKGYYVPETKLAYQIPCPYNHYANKTGQAKCTRVTSGFYAPHNKYHSSISFESSKTCAIGKPAGEVYCWESGKNPSSAISGLSLAYAITSGESHSCALLLDGSIRCWGNNEHEQLRHGQTIKYEQKPVTVSSEETFVLLDSKFIPYCIRRW